jgi:hypothetical protein
LLRIKVVRVHVGGVEDLVGCTSTRASDKQSSGQREDLVGYQGKRASDKRPSGQRESTGNGDGDESKFVVPWMHRI